MGVITNKQIKQFIADKYGDFDQIKIDRTQGSLGVLIDIKCFIDRQRVTWFQGWDDKDFFSQFENHTNWQLGIKR